MTVWVLDCSLAISWCFEDEKTAWTESVLQRLQKDLTLIVPPIWSLEVSNVLLTCERRGRLEALQATQFAAHLGALPIRMEDPILNDVFDNVLPLARTMNLTSYDASYLELALRKKLPLATLDKKLAHAARLLKIPQAR